MANPDLRFNKKNVTVRHDSARGNVTRNSGHFTRGSQLFIHQMLMMFAGIKIPFLIWLVTFCAMAVAMLGLMMGTNETSLSLMKCYAAIWNYIGLDADKMATLTLQDGHRVIVPFFDVPNHPNVIAAWARFTGALSAAFFMSLLVAIPLSLWFVGHSRGRGSSILEERHERGALLVENQILQREIRLHNRRCMKATLARRDPPLSIDAVRTMTPEERNALGIHRPYSLAGCPFPWGLEQSHVMMIGTTGTGKTTALRDLVRQIRQRGHRAVIFDLTGAFVSSFYDPQSDTILNPSDARCPSWSIFGDCKSYADFTAAAEAIIPSANSSADPFWPMAARTLLVEMCLRLVEHREATNRQLAHQLLFAELSDINAKLDNTLAEPLTSPASARMAQSIRAVLNTYAQSIVNLPESGEAFSIKDWMTEDYEAGSILFISSDHTDLVVNRSLLTLWMDLAVNALMRTERTRDIKTWFLFDEVHALHKLPAIEHGLQTARAYGGAFVLGLHSFDKLAETYGEEGAVNLSSLARTKLILATADKNTAEKCADFIGHREVREMDEAYSYGYNNTRDASTLTPRTTVKPLVIPDDIANLPSMHGFIKFPDGFPAARIRIGWHDNPEVAPGFMRSDRSRDILMKEPPASDGTDGDKDDGEGGAHGTVKNPEQKTDRRASAEHQAADAKQDLKFDYAQSRARPEQEDQLTRENREGAGVEAPEHDTAPDLDIEAEI
ncbi:MAG: type IV secretion system DNA-binding domain-containing protein [Parasphingopyxis sp.]